MDNCIFCKTARNEITSPRLAENEHAIMIRDTNPLAKDHLLVISREHFHDINKIPDWLFERVLSMAKTYGRKSLPNGFRLVINTGEDAGQTVKHFHVHVLGGEKLRDL